MSNYGFRNLLKQEPTAISAFIISTLNVFVLAGVIHLTKDVVLATNTTLVLGLGLFYVRPLTASKSSIAELARKRAPARRKATTRSGAARTR